MKNIIFFLLFLMVSCTGKGAFTNRQFKEQHQKFHQAHITFLTNQSAIIANLSDTIINKLNKNTDSTVILEYLQDFWGAIDEFVITNRIYKEDLINTKKTTNIIIEINTANGDLESYVLSHKPDIEFNVKSQQYESAIKNIKVLKLFYDKELIEIKQAAEKYMVLCH